ncbi:MAG TPA: TetR family transcriptional regulator [Luteolibacter sp.]|nr:TetR family transcriptional regulator [Luteolibacter sp.]
MREEKIARSKPKQQLLEAAERLFAERGFEAVSVRDITKLAGANVAAVNYHFGDRENLVLLVISRLVDPVTEERMARLESVEKKWSGKSAPVEEILDALTRPLATAKRKSLLPETMHHRLLGRIFSLPPEIWPDLSAERMRQMTGRFMRALGKSLPTVPAEELVWRMHFTMGGMAHMLLLDALPDKTGKAQAAAVGLDAMIGRFIRFAAAGLREGVEVDETKPAGPQATFDF